MKLNRLSYSAATMYGSCPRKYKYHYIERYRSKMTSGALIFGDAIDSAINALLKKENSDPYGVFDQSFMLNRVGDKTDVYIPECVDIAYAEADFDEELLTLEDKTLLFDKATSLGLTGDVLTLFYNIKEAKKDKGFVNLSFNEKTYYNYCNWLSLRRKGFIVITSYKEKVLPNLTQVHEVQKYFKVENNEGDSVIGYIDLIANWKDIGTVIFDLKTSAREYQQDSVITSPQLSLYVASQKSQYNTNKAGYIVARKTIRKNRKKTCNKCGHDGSGGRHKTCNNEINAKRCNGDWLEIIDPEADIQVIISDIPEHMQDITMEHLDQTNHAIKQEVFTRNFNSCDSPFPCPFKKLCLHNKEEDVVQLEEKKEK